MRKVAEGSFHTPTQVREYLVAGLELVNELDPPEDLRPAVFVQAVTLLSNKQVVFEQATPMPLSLDGLRGRG